MSTAPPPLPPPFADLLLKALLGKEHGDIHGDMVERFYSIAEVEGVSEANRLYWIATLGCLWPILTQKLFRFLFRLVQIVFGARRQLAYSNYLASPDASPEDAVPLPARVTGNAAIPPWLNALLLMVYLGFLGGVAWFTWEMDCAYGLSLFWGGYVVVLVMVGFVSVPCLVARQGRLVGRAMAVSITAVFVLSCFDQNVDKALYRLQPKIRPGMTRAQVEQLAVQYFPADGRFGPARWHHPTYDDGRVDTSVGTLVVGPGEMVLFFTPQGRVKSTYVQD